MRTNISIELTDQERKQLDQFCEENNTDQESLVQLFFKTISSGGFEEQLLLKKWFELTTNTNYNAKEKQNLWKTKKKPTQ